VCVETQGCVLTARPGGPDMVHYSHLHAFVGIRHVTTSLPREKRLKAAFGHVPLVLGGVVMPTAR
jgi:hypothetical protein